MIKNMKLALVIFPVLFIISCSYGTNNSFYVDPNYEYSNNPKELSLIPIIEQDIVMLSNKDDLNNLQKLGKKDVKLIVKNMIEDDVVKMLSQNNYKVDKIKYVGIQDTFKEFPTEIRENALPISFFIPVIDKKNIDFALILQNIQFGRFYHGTHTVYMNGLPTRVGGSSYLSSKVDYIIWDYKKDKSVCYGRVETNTEAPLKMSENAWRQNIDHMVRKIFEHSPYRIR